MKKPDTIGIKDVLLLILLFYCLAQHTAITILLIIVVYWIDKDINKLKKEVKRLKKDFKKLRGDIK